MASPRRPKTDSSPSRTVIPPAPAPPPDLAKMVGENEDLMMQVFVRLPIKSIVRFKCVSRTWRQWLSDPHFDLRYRAASGLLLGNPLHLPSNLVKLDPQVSPPSFAALDGSATHTILSSSNGLLLLSSSAQDLPVTYWVYNPTTNDSRRLPSPPSPFEFRPVLAFDTAFDLSRLPHYQVVSVCRGQELGFRIQIYSSGTASWRVLVDEFFDVPPGFEFAGGVCWNGCINWMGQGFGAYFNLEEERLRRMPLPPLPEDWDHWEEEIEYFGCSGGHLHLMLIEDNRPSALFIVYELMNDYTAWVRRFAVDLGAVLAVYPEMNLELDDDDPILDFSILAFSMMCFVRSEADHDSYVVLRIPGRIVKFYFRTEALEEITRMDEPFQKWKWYDVHQFIKCIACV